MACDCNEFSYLQHRHASKRHVSKSLRYELSFQFPHMSIVLFSGLRPNSYNLQCANPCRHFKNLCILAFRPRLFQELNLTII